MTTPLQKADKLAKAIGISALYLKREDQHPYGSHKGRSIPVMIDEYIKGGDKSFAISSSGNAALAAAMHIQHLNTEIATGNSPFLKGVPKAGDFVTLDIFVGQHIALHKEEKLRAYIDDSIRVLKKERPLQAVTLAAQEGVRSLRQSQDDAALNGYAALAQEIAEAGSKEKGGKIGAVFIGTSSGTTAQALAQYFISKKLPIQVHIVQTSECHPMSEALESYDGPDEESTADAIVDKIASRKDVLIPLIKKTGGNGWVVTNQDIENAQDMVAEHTGEDLSTNGVLGIAGAIKAAEIGYDFNGDVVCIVGGE